MAIKADREYRTIQIPDICFRAEEEENYRVSGYATTWDDPYVMMEYDGIKYMEQIDRNALVGANMDDVIFLYNHEGMVYARMSNGTLKLSINDRGLYIEADLSSTEASRQMYESIRAGLVTQMSWAFTIEEDSYNEKTHTRSILKVNKVYDVSAVSIPANPNTDVSARSYFDGVIEEERRRDLERRNWIDRMKSKLCEEVSE